MTQPRPAVVRFYFDADVLGVARVVATLRTDATYPGDRGATVHKRARPPCPVQWPAVKDVDWIPVVAARGWLIITRDVRIQAHAAEVAAVRDYGAKMVVLAGSDARSTWAQLEVLMTRWREIEGLYDEPGSFIRRVTRRGKILEIPLA